jgi:hypothetical protein
MKRPTVVGRASEHPLVRSPSPLLALHTGDQEQTFTDASSWPDHRSPRSRISVGSVPHRDGGVKCHSAKMRRRRRLLHQSTVIAHPNLRGRSRSVTSGGPAATAARTRSPPQAVASTEDAFGRRCGPTQPLTPERRSAERGPRDELDHRVRARGSARRRRSHERDESEIGGSMARPSGPGVRRSPAARRRQRRRGGGSSVGRCRGRAPRPRGRTRAASDRGRPTRQHRRARLRRGPVRRRTTR